MMARLSMNLMDTQPVVVGFPYMANGRGEDTRSALRALVAAGLDARVYDLFQMRPYTDPGHVAVVGNRLTDRLSETINLFILNGNEIEGAFERLGGKLSASACNIVYPAWELSRYPAAWGALLDRFDEVWTHSPFSAEALSGATTKRCLAIPPATEPVFSTFYSRGAFELPESAFLFLFLFDTRSFIERKNPYAVVEAFQTFLRRHSFADARLVIKVADSHGANPQMEAFRSDLNRDSDRIILMDRLLTDNELKNLIRLCDCFVSLHRAEGLGRGMAEAMYLGKPVIATAYSGNLAFMDADKALLVDYRLIPVPEEAYPCWQDQVWADPDVEQAAQYMEQLYRDRSLARDIGQRAALSMRTGFSFLAAGLRFKERLDRLMAVEGEPNGR